MVVLQTWCAQVHELLPRAVQVEGVAEPVPIRKPTPKELQHIVCKLHVAMGFVFSAKPGKHFRLAPGQAAAADAEETGDDEAAEDDDTDEGRPVKRRAMGGG